MNRAAIFLLAAVFLSGCGNKQQPPAEESVTQQIGSVGTVAQTGKEQKLQQYIEKGKDSLTHGDLSMAIKNFDTAIKQFPQDPTAYMILGETFLRLQNYDKAIAVYSSLINADPENGNAYYFLGVTQGVAGDKEAAKVSAQKSIEIFQKKQDRENYIRSVALLYGLNNMELPSGQMPEQAGSGVSK